MTHIRLKNLTLANFKNYENVELNFNGNLVCFTGNNGQGKTNLLDAIYYLSFCKSFINNSDVLNIKNISEYFTINGNFIFDETPENLFCGFSKNDGKIFKRNKKEYPRLAEHIGFMPLVILSPSDIFLLHDGSEIRRKFIDGIIAQFDATYLHNLLQYNKAVVQRNALLKNFASSRNYAAEMLEIWDMQLIDYGTKIFDVRKKFIADFTHFFTENYNLLAPANEEVKLVYESHLLENNMPELLKINLQKDLAATYTTHGVHKDDLQFLLQEKVLKKNASQGQQKTYLTALKLAQYKFLAESKKTKPILLIDDVYDKLDSHRVALLLNMITESDFGQVFITDTNNERLTKIFNDIRKPFEMFWVENGTIKKLN